MKKIIFKSLVLSSVCLMALPVAAQRFIDCSEGNAECDVLYASDEIFTTPTAGTTGAVQQADWALVKTNDKPLAESHPINTLPSGNEGGYRVVLPKGATQNVNVPDRRTNSRVDVLPDGSIQTTTVEITTEATPDGYQETTRRIERLDTEKQGAVWVEKSLADKVDYGDAAHDWEAAKGETLRSLLMQ